MALQINSQALCRAGLLLAALFVVEGCVPAGGGNGGADAGAPVADTGCTNTSCPAGQSCNTSGVCEDANPGCTRDRDCELGERCLEGICQQDNVNRCNAHSECQGTGEVCMFAPGADEGECKHYTEQTCESDADCAFSDGTDTIEYMCDAEAGVCKAGDFDSCSVQNDCMDGLDCVEGLCLTPCTSNLECDMSRFCAAGKANHCWYNLCGNGPAGELSGNFTPVDNGNLGGACLADAPQGATPTICEVDTDCAVLGDNARCNTALLECEVTCSNDNSCGDDPWASCKRTEAAAVPACDNDTPCAEGTACEDGSCVVPCSSDLVCGEHTRCTGDLTDPVGDDAKFCVAVDGVCQTMAGDGHCVEVRANNDGTEWVGLCIAGGYLGEGETCGLDAERSEKELLCGNGAVCAIATDEGTGTCQQGCAADDSHGSVRCANEADSCLGGACIPESAFCDPADTNGCTENTRCGFFGWELDSGYCMQAKPADERSAEGESCDFSGDCADANLCLTYNDGVSRCTQLCRPADDGGSCPAGKTCRRAQDIFSDGENMVTSYGLCMQAQ
jgi:hypothetical protein